jgi:hypothetical protein
VTPITLTDVQNCTGSLRNKIPGLLEIMPRVCDVAKYDRAGFYNPGANTNKDILLFLVGETFTDFDNSTNTTHSMRVMISSVYM